MGGVGGCRNKSPLYIYKSLQPHSPLCSWGISLLGHYFYPLLMNSFVFIDIPRQQALLYSNVWHGTECELQLLTRVRLAYQQSYGSTSGALPWSVQHLCNVGYGKVCLFHTAVSFRTFSSSLPMTTVLNFFLCQATSHSISAQNRPLVCKTPAALTN